MPSRQHFDQDRNSVPIVDNTTLSSLKIHTIRPHIKQIKGLPTFFLHPQHSWQRLHLFISPPLCYISLIPMILTKRWFSSNRVYTSLGKGMKSELWWSNSTDLYTGTRVDIGFWIRKAIDNLHSTLSLGSTHNNHCETWQGSAHWWLWLLANLRILENTGLVLVA